MSSIGQAAGYIGGAIIGSFVGYPMLGAAIGGMIGGAIDPPKGPNIEGPRLNDLSGQTCAYGTPIPRLYGTKAVYGNVFWLEGGKYKEVKNEEEQGGKGGPSQTVTTYSYFATFGVALAEGPVTGYRRIWINNQLWFDAGEVDPVTHLPPPTNAQEMADYIVSTIGSVSKRNSFTFYTGAADQMPDPRYEAEKGVGNASAFRGLCYIMFYDLPLEPYGNSLQGAQVKVELINGDIIEAPILLGDISYSGRITYSDEVGFTTAEVIDEYCTGSGATGTFTGVVRFRDYDHGGNLLRTLDKPATMPQYAGNSVTTWYETYLVRNDRYGFFVGHTPYPNMLFHCDFPSSPIIVTGPGLSLQSSASYYENCYVGGYYWIPAGTCISRFQFNLSGGETEYITLAGFDSGMYQSFGVFEDPVTGRFFARYGNDSYQYISELDLATMTFDWTHSWAGGARHGIPGGSGIAVYDNRLLRSWYSDLPGGPPPYLNHAVLYEIGTSGLTEIGSHDINWFATSHVFGIGGGLANIGGKIYNMLDMMGTGDTVPLGEIVESECLKSRVLTAGDLDMTALTQPVRGYTITRPAAIRASIEHLRGAFPFDVVQRGYDLVGVPRGQSSVGSVLEEDLDARVGGDSSGIRLQVPREMNTQIPTEVHVFYSDADRDYTVNEQWAEHLGTDTVNSVNVELNLVMTADEAAQCAERLRNMYWLERRDFKFTIPPTRRQYEAGDVITVSHAGQDHEIRLTQITDRPDGILECDGKPNRASAYVSSAVGSSGPSAPVVISVAGPTEAVLADLPRLTADNDANGFALAATGRTSGWKGGALYSSVDSGASWQRIADFFAPGSILGTVGNVLADAPTSMVDTQSTLKVYLLSGELSSVTDAQFYNGANLFAIGDNGRWEIVGARDCTLEVDGSYTLSHLLRGRYGTEWATGQHGVTDKVVLLNTTGKTFVPLDLSAVDSSRLYKAVSFGKDLDSAWPQYFTWSANNLKPLAPVLARGSRAPVTGDWTVGAIRRSRQPVEPFSGFPLPVGESAALFDAEIYTSSGYSTVARTISGLTTPEFTWTEAEQLIDFGSAQGTIYGKLYQVSPTVGRGLPLTFTLTRDIPTIKLPSPTKALLHCNGADNGVTYTDETGSTWASSGAAPNTQTSDKKFGTASLHGGGTGTINRVVGSSLRFTGDFTVEFWGNHATWADLFRIGDGTGNGDIDVNSYGGYAIRLVATGGATTDFDVSLSGGVWNHIAIVRYNGVIKVYLNGTASVTTLSYSATIPSSESSVFYFDFVNGTKYDEIRISNTARYTANFSVATAEFDMD